MTAEEKKSVAFFIDLASSWARGGYFPGEREYSFSDDSDTAGGSKGAAVPLVMVIGDVSDSGEDAQLLDKMLGSINLSKDGNCFIANIVKYRPPDNREPQPDEIAACAGFIESQIQSLNPRFILCVGSLSAQAMLHNAEPIEKLRGRLIDYKANGMTIPLAATYHPNDLLRNKDLKRPCWDDLKLLRAALGAVESGAR
jgi:DNA polymerase